MRIGVDSHILADKFQGSRTYLLELLRALARIDNRNDYILYSPGPSQAKALLEPVADRLDFRPLASRGPVGRLLFEFPRRAKRDNLDLLYHQYIAPPFAACRTAVTIHDILFESLPECFSPLFVMRSRLLVRRSARRASLVFTDSEFSYHELLERYGLDEEKLHIVSCAVDRSRFRPLSETELPPAAESFRRHVPFILYVGRLDPRKNVSMILEALALRKRRGDLAERLLITGHKGYRHREVFRAVERAKLQRDVIFLGGVDDQALPALYALAEAFVFPSRGEGFGLPVLEAMACGTPVITTDRGALGEVAGDAALHVDLDSVDALEGALDTVLSDAALRASMREKGLHQAAKFSWDRSARDFYAALQTLR